MTSERLCAIFVPPGNLAKMLSEVTASRIYDCIDMVVMTYETLTSIYKRATAAPAVVVADEDRDAEADTEGEADELKKLQRRQKIRAAARSFMDIEWRHIVVDEGTTLANDGTDMVAACHHIRAHDRILVPSHRADNNYQ